MWAVGSAGVCAMAPPRGRARGGVAVGAPHALEGLLCGRRGAPEGRAMALPSGCAARAPPDAPGSLLCGRRGAPGVCRSPAAWVCLGGGVVVRSPHALGSLLCGRGVRRGMCHSPAEEVCQRGVPWPCRGGARGVRRRWATACPGRNLCGRRGAPEGCAIALPRGPRQRWRRCWAAACPGRPPMWAGVCAGGVCHSPAEGAPRIPSTWM